MTEQLLSSYLNFQVVTDTVGLILNHVSDEIRNRILDHRSKILSVEQTLFGVMGVMNTVEYTPDCVDEISEDIETEFSHLENYAPYMLKTEKLQKFIKLDVTKTLTSSDDRWSRKQFSLSSKRQLEVRRSEISKSQKTSDWQVYQPKPILLDKEELSTIQKEEIMDEERKRVKKKVIAAEQAKLIKEQKKRQKQEKQYEENSTKLEKELIKKNYTFDYNGQVLLKRNFQPNQSILKEIIFRVDAPLDQEQTRIKSKSQSNDQSNRQEGFYNGTPQKTLNTTNNNMQNKDGVSIIPFINLRSGVTLKEINRKGEEKVLNSKQLEPQISNLNRRDYLNLLNQSEDEIVSALASYHLGYASQNISRTGDLVNSQLTQPVSTQKELPLLTQDPTKQIIDSINEYSTQIKNKLPRLVQTKQQYLLNVKQRHRQLEKQLNKQNNDTSQTYISESIHLQSQIHTLKSQIQSEQYYDGQKQAYSNARIIKSYGSDQKSFNRNRANQSLGYINFSTDRSQIKEILELSD